jgi:ATP-dependent RNA helicase RhlE
MAMSFPQFGQTIGLAPNLLRAATDLGWTVPTPVQIEAMPAVLRGQDVQVQAQTGSGKTGAFALPVLQALQGLQIQAPHAPRRVRALVLVPTRELAAQVGEVFRSLTQHLPVPIRVAVVFGGVSINPQMMNLRGGADVVVATPGRLLDLVEHNALKLGSVSTLVLDEADRLLDLGFAEELGRILALLPAQRQNLLFSATFEEGVQALADKLLREPVKIEVAPAPATDAVILQRAIAVDTPKRTQLLRHLFKTQGWKRVLVFVATKHAAEMVAEKLYKVGIFASPFHGELSQGARQQVLDEFKANRWDMVITTDLASRGIDIAQLSVVVNYDLPRSATDYVHRIGRTGRAGHSGEAVSFVTADMEAHFRLIEKRQGLSLPREQIEGFEPTEVVAVAAAPAQGNGGAKGLRPSKKDKLRAAGKLPPLGT